MARVHAYGFACGLKKREFGSVRVVFEALPGQRRKGCLRIGRSVELQKLDKILAWIEDRRNPQDPTALEIYQALRPGMLEWDLLYILKTTGA